MRRDGVFHAAAVGFPSCEPRAALPATAARLNFFGAPELTAEEQTAAEMAEMEGGEDRVVFLSDVWLDRPETFEQLSMIFSGEPGWEVPGGRVGGVEGRRWRCRVVKGLQRCLSSRQLQNGKIQPAT